MNFSPCINLADRSSIAVISSLWNKEDNITDIKNLFVLSDFRLRWKNIESNVMLQLREILLPKELKTNLENLLQPMGTQIIKWISLTQPAFKVCHHLPECIMFFWTERGTLDYDKTAKFMIDHCSDKELNFCLACIFCIENVINELWPEVGQMVAEKLKQNSYIIEALPVIYWVYYLNGEVEALMVMTEYCGIKNVYEFGLLFTLDIKCSSTASYFLERMPPERKKKMAHMALQNLCHASRPRDGNVLMFLFGYLEVSDIDEIIKENTYSVLASLLEWPCQEFFMPVAHSSWNSLSSLDYLNLFQDIVESVSRYSGDIYKILAKEFWRASPSCYKKYAIAKCISGTFLSRLFLYENTYEIIQMIFKDCSQNEKYRMIFYFEGMNICDLLVKKERWDLLKLFVTSCITTHDVSEEFIALYEMSKPYYCSKQSLLRTSILINKIRDWY